MKPRQILLCLVLSTLVDILVLPRDGLQCCFQYVNIKTTKRARRQARLPGKRVPSARWRSSTRRLHRKRGIG